jgi:CheY-like chemotaxis protein
MKKELFIIDDDPIHRLIVSKMMGITDSLLIINQSENGKVALDQLEKIKDSNHQVIVLLDINMPILNGWGFLDQIEKLNFFNILQLSIYIVSSSTDKGDILKAGLYEFVKGFHHKPLSKEDINNIISVQ